MATVAHRATDGVARLVEPGEQHLRDFLKHANYLILSAGTDGQLLFVNRAWQRTLGYSEERVRAGLSFFDTVDASYLDAARDAVARTLAGESLFELELLLVAQDGQHVRVSGELSCRFDDDGQPLALRCIFRDITAQSAAEARASVIDERYRAVVDVLSDGVTVLSASGVIEAMNPSAERMLGVSAGELIGRTLDSVPVRSYREDGREVPADEHPALVTLRTGASFSEVTLGVRRGNEGGPLVWLSVNTRPLVNEGEARPHGVVSSFRDITQRRRIEAALRESAAQFQGILETVRSLAVCLDTSGNVSFVNEFVLELTGWTRDEVVGRSWFERFIPPGAEIHTLFYEMIARGEVPLNYENEILTRSGARRVISWDSTVLRDGDGRVIGTASIGQDITDRARIARMKDELIGVVSHEMRTPLAAIRGSLDLLGALPLDIGDRERRLIDMAARNTDRLMRLTTDLLDLERLESGDAPLEQRAIRADTLLRTSRDVVAALAEKAGITITIQPTPATVWADGDRLTQVLTNLIGNAVKFSPRGSSISLQALPHAGTGGDEVRFAVADRGRGIPSDRLENVFDRFAQIDASDARRGGAGLGLAICRAIVRQHGGRIWVESAPGRGSTFYFTVPTADRGVELSLGAA